MTINNIFSSKEHYLNFRAAWAKAANDGHLTAAHHVLFNLVTGKPFYNGFTPVTNSNKLSNGAYLNLSLYDAARTLRLYKGDAVHLLEAQAALAKNDPSLDEPQGRFTKYTKRENFESIVEKNTRYLNSFLGYFDGTITAETLANLEIPAVFRISSDSMEGIRFIERVANGAAPTMETLYAFTEMKEVA